MRRVRPSSISLNHRYIRRRLTRYSTSSSEAAPSELPYRSHPFPQQPSASPEALSRHPRLNSLKDAKPFSSFLTDTFSRQHDYLRISITERCNLRCLYCMPEEGVPLSPSTHLLTTPEIVYLSTLFVSQGVTKIRLTGGEPTVRKDILPMMQEIGKLRRDGLKELCLTTNGISLHRKLDSMVEAGLTGVNLSLDTLDPFQFQIMTRRKGFEAVMKSIEKILDLNERHNAGIKLKINCVVMRGMNDREILPFVELGRDKAVEVRFIEYMPFDGNKWSKGKMFSYQEMLDVIKEKYPSFEKVPDHKNNTSKTYQVPGFKGRVGFITSMTHNFCGTCNRLRITSDGNLKVCLFGNTEVSLRDMIRKENNNQPIYDDALQSLNLLESARQAARAEDEGHPVNERERELLNIIGAAVKRKKAKHAGIGILENMKNRPMILIDDPIFDANDLNTSLEPTAKTSNWASRRPSSLIQSRSIPLHMLAHHNFLHQTCRPYSTSQQSARSQSPPTSQKPERAETSPFSDLPTASNAKLPHLTPRETVHMTSIYNKPETSRLATAVCRITFSNPTAFSLLTTGDGLMKKGDVLSVARIAGIMAAKKAADIIPLAHPGLGITGVEVDVSVCPPYPKDTNSVNQSDCKPSHGLHGSVLVTSSVSCHGRTGVEMEAMMAVLGAALTVYDMCKAVDKGMVIGEARVVRKRGGKSGDWEEGIRVSNAQGNSD
ncbi:molybdenum cofactor biosynthesis protein 1 B [Arthroderma uncinatum]|uniref:molybdenum cofactor biosynthesis protein 1 B n=1 Tax=Arthroderma uncinatum TaxID=74035 RepID=UPI00144AA33C|nr:molybdenum cofactor biosynthesis protein 1 B [Arthroderma uncinatum]KAF3481134.1 molybdenum cofactor biosynthesis protein 1 B [Arthroderma uncinatum]